ncbi:MAG TPA: UvrD-helicase domain-containing protein [Bacteroidota bacterium]|nr:UvrD-helicase domain-containing protein [Bacteroidota bacterium]
MLKTNSPQPIQLPDFTLVIASAGSGKTTELTRRYLRLVMTDGMPYNNLRQILAITFTRNAAREMKERILETLKRAALRDPYALEELGTFLPFDNDSLSAYAAGQIDEILDNYSDFQIQTIDSFITRVLRASATDLGLPPDFEVEFNARAVFDEALEFLARELATDAAKQELFRELVDLVSEQRRGKFLWNPFEYIAKKLRELHVQLSAQRGEPIIRERREELQSLRQRILQQVIEIAKTARSAGLELRKNFESLVERAEAGDVETVFSRIVTQDVFKKPSGKVNAEAITRINTMREELARLVDTYTTLLARTRYLPYIEAYRMLQHHLDEVVQRRGTVVLHDANRALARMLSAEVIPEIYYSLGERVHHYLIDEFQDTSPLQWAVLRPLIENSLGEHGSLFLVGDTKQSIYTFRGADWRIMARMLEREEFPSVRTRMHSLTTNYRSAEAIVQFTKQVFHSRVPEVVPEKTSNLSGLTSFEQEVHEGKRGKGYVKVHILPAPETDEEIGERRESPPERDIVLRIINDCRARGYAYGDIAILSPRNDHVVEVSRWLNAAGIRFISHSSLDIRTRKLTGELLSLLQFLDSPVDDLAFATFLMGTVFATSVPTLNSRDVQALILRACATPHRVPLYREFRATYGELWNRHFEHLFNLVGYLPLYDLVAEVYKAFNLFEHHPDEEGTLMKFLEVAKNFEANGQNSLKDFLAYAGVEDREEADAWNIATAEGEDAVRIMTVHKAKGLGFPILITLFYDRSVKPENLFVVGEDEAVQLLHVTDDGSKKSETVAEYYEHACALAEVDDLNKLYVSLTRAKEEMYVVSVKRKRGDRPSVFFPHDGYEVGTPTRKLVEEVAGELPATILHLPTRGFAQTAGEALRLRETRRGELIHNVLSEIHYCDSELEKTLVAGLERWQRRMREPIDVAATVRLLVDFLQLPQVKPWFTETAGRSILNEQEIVDASGQLHRVDRIVVDQEAVTVLDYKTGEEQEEHHEQVRHYRQIVRELYPEKPVQGILLYLDRKIVREVR